MVGAILLVENLFTDKKKHYSNTINGEDIDF